MDENDLHEKPSSSATPGRDTTDEVSWRRSRWTLIVIGIVWVAVLARSNFSDPVLVGWADDYAEAISTSAITGRSALLYFTSGGCPNCRKMDRVFADPEVVRSVQGFVPVRIDAWQERELANRFNVIGVPAYVVVDSGGRMIAHDIGYKPAHEFTRFLEHARSVTPSQKD